MQLNNALGNRQPQAASLWLLCTRPSVITVKKMLCHFWFYALSVIRNRNF